MLAMTDAAYAYVLLLVALFAFSSRAAPNPGPPPWTIPARGNATLTHYDLPRDNIASCGCVPGSTHYPTAAINQLAYGSATSFGPACGRCFHLTLSSTPMAPLPPEGDGKAYAPGDAAAPSITIKATDLCPAGASSWCSATTAPDKPNSLGSMLHFDLAFPSQAIPKNFFPLNAQSGDYGVWWVDYVQVPCTKWAGWTDPHAWGSDWSEQDDACCAPDPMFDPEDGGAPPVGNSHNYGNDSTTITNALNAAKIARDAQIAVCPSYSRLAASVAKDTNLNDLLLAQVPNTSNVLTRKKGDDGSWARNAATTQAEVQSTMTILALMLAPSFLTII